jgi:8-oxo-dGTP diphosphatase
MVELMNSSAVGTSLIVVNPQGKILLLLRDDKPDIKYPGMWDIPGGNLEGDETPLECIQREIQEELGVAMPECRLFEAKQFPDRFEYTFWVAADIDIASITLTEGQRLAWFSENEAGSTQLAFGFNSTISSFFSKAPFLPERQ